MLKQDALLLIEKARESLKALCRANYMETIPQRLTARLDSTLCNDGLQLTPKEKAILILPLPSAKEQKDSILEPLLGRCGSDVLDALGDWAENLKDVIGPEESVWKSAVRQQAEEDSRDVEQWNIDRFGRIIDWVPVNRQLAGMMLMTELSCQIREAVRTYLLQSLSGRTLADIFARYVYPDLIKRVLAGYADIEKKLDEAFDEVAANVNELYNDDRYMKTK